MQTVEKFLGSNGYVCHELDSDRRAITIAELIADGKIIGYMTGRMEFGPRALGARSIIGDARSAKTLRQ